MNEIVKFEWAPSYRGKRVDPNEVGKVVRSIERRDGVCHPRALWEAARAEESPIHGAFEWDPERAAEEHWTWTARRLLGGLRVVKATAADHGPAFVHVRPAPAQDGTAVDPGGYMSIERALRDPDIYARVLQDAVRQAEGLLHRYKKLKELAPIQDAVERVKRGLEASEQKAA